MRNSRFFLWGSVAILTLVAVCVQSLFPEGVFADGAVPVDPFAGKTIADLGWVAGGIWGMTDWDRIRHYNDEINNSRGFLKMNSGALADTDAEWWPTEASYVVIGGGIWLRPGIHKGSFSGSATVENHWGPGKITNVLSESGSTTFDYVVPDGTPDADGVVNATNWAIRFSTGVTNVRLIAPGVPTENTPMFSSEIVGYYAKFGGLRFMDPMGTNGNKTTTWESRVKPTKRGGNGGFSVGNGKPVEHIVELANAAYREPGSRLKQIWLNVPHMATDDYVTNFAAYLRDHLDPGLVVNIELSNETWNYSFAAESYFRLMAQAEVAAGESNLNYDGADINTQRLRIMARRLREIALMFESGFGQWSLNSRVRMVLGLQAANGMRGAKSVLEYLKTQYPDRPVSSYLYAVSPAYYTHYDPANVANFQTEKDVYDDLEGTGSYWNNTANTVKLIGQIAAMARTYGLKTACYEGGPHLNDAPADKKALIASFRYSEWGRLHLKSVATKLWAAGIESLFFYQITPARHDWAVTENRLLALSFQAEQLKGMDELMSASVPDPKIWNSDGSGAYFLPKERLQTFTPASPVYDRPNGSILSNMEAGVSKWADFAFSTATGGAYSIAYTGGYSASSTGTAYLDFSIDWSLVGSVSLDRMSGSDDPNPPTGTLTGITVSRGFHELRVQMRNDSDRWVQVSFHWASLIREPDPIPAQNPVPEPHPVPEQSSGSGSDSQSPSGTGSSSGSGTPSPAEIDSPPPASVHQPSGWGSSYAMVFVSAPTPSAVSRPTPERVSPQVGNPDRPEVFRPGVPDSGSGKSEEPSRLPPVLPAPELLRAGRTIDRAIMRILETNRRQSARLSALDALIRDISEKTVESWSVKEALKKLAVRKIRAMIERVKHPVTRK